LSRVTYDIDTFNITDQKVRKILAEFNISDIGARVMTVCENFDHRLEKVNLPLKHIDLFVLSDYDMIISKLGSTRPKDICDIIDSGLIFRIDFNRLEKIIREEVWEILDVYGVTLNILKCCVMKGGISNEVCRIHGRISKKFNRCIYS